MSRKAPLAETLPRVVREGDEVTFTISYPTGHTKILFTPKGARLFASRLVQAADEIARRQE